jgi:hypothetical protein
MEKNVLKSMDLLMQRLNPYTMTSVRDAKASLLQQSTVQSAGTQCTHESLHNSTTVIKFVFRICQQETCSVCQGDMDYMLYNNTKHPSVHKCCRCTILRGALLYWAWTDRGLVHIVYKTFSIPVHFFSFSFFSFFRYVCTYWQLT